jgi:4-diphosphocytidyl-2-C-methyl-D-erythritol kinase
MPLFKAPAKINLGLEVGRLNPDGYHYIETFMQTVDLCDLIEIDHSDHLQFSVEGYDFPPEEENLCFKAYQSVCEYTGIDRAIRMKLTKKIPVGAGLGGGSSDAATVIMALNQIWELRLKKRQLVQIGAGVGADVPFFITAESGAGLCWGKGEKVKVMEPLFKGTVLIVFTGLKISTKEAYKNIDRNLTNNKKNPKLKGYILQTFPAKMGLTSLKNDFSPVVFQQYRDLEGLALLLDKQGSLYSSLSGSGSAIYGLFSDAEEAHRAFNNLPDLAFKVVANTPAPFYF